MAATAANRLVAVGNKWVILRVQGPVAAPAEIKTFFDSFKLTGGR